MDAHPPTLVFAIPLVVTWSTQILLMAMDSSVKSDFVEQHTTHQGHSKTEIVFVPHVVWSKHAEN